MEKYWEGFKYSTFIELWLKTVKNLRKFYLKILEMKVKQRLLVPKNENILTKILLKPKICHTFDVLVLVDDKASLRPTNILIDSKI